MTHVKEIQSPAAMCQKISNSLIAEAEMFRRGRDGEGN